MTIALLLVGVGGVLVLGFLVSVDARAVVADSHCQACDGRGWVYFGATCDECGASGQGEDAP